MSVVFVVVTACNIAATDGGTYLSYCLSKDRFINQGRMQDFEKGGHSSCRQFIILHIHANCVRSTHACEACQSRGVWGHAPPENFDKLHPLRLNLGAFLVIYDPCIGATEV